MLACAGDDDQCGHNATVQELLERIGDREPQQALFVVIFGLCGGGVIIASCFSCRQGESTRMAMQSAGNTAKAPRPSFMYLHGVLTMWSIRFFFD